MGTYKAMQSTKAMSAEDLKEHAVITVEMFWYLVWARKHQANLSRWGEKKTLVWQKPNSG